MSYDLARWDPFVDLLSLQDDMNRLFREFFGRRGGRLAKGDSSIWFPALDMEETKDEIIVKAELPGIHKEEISLQVQADTLTLSGVRKSESETKDKTIHLVERSYGKFQRSIALPCKVDATRAKAVYEDGVLTVRLPKQEEVKPKEIAIEVK
jgi:HSP20 family protein